MIRRYMKSFLYLIYSEIGILIGKSSDIHRRFAIIDAHSPLELKLFRVYKIQSNGLHVRRLHKLFNRKHIRGGWFALDLKDIQQIDRYIMDNKGTRILDNMKKVYQSSAKADPEITDHPHDALIQEISNLEYKVKMLRGALDGRKKL